VIDARLSGSNGSAADSALLELLITPARDRDEEHGELLELSYPCPLGCVVAPRTCPRGPCSEGFLFAAVAEEKEHQASIAIMR
jgi:hypothetical protein